MESAWLDRSRLLDAIGEDPIELEAVIELYIADTGEHITAVAAAVAAGDADAVSRLGHKGAGLSAACGVLGLEAPFRELEIQGRRGDLDAAARTLRTLQQRMPIVSRLLTRDPPATWRAA